MKGLLIVVSGPSGAGKGTVLNKALEKNSKLKYSVSVTTRAPRAGEIDGINYFFRTVDEYKQVLHNGEFLEHQEVYGNLYGTPARYVEMLRNEGYDVILEIDTKGAMSVKKKIPDCVMVFLTPKDRETLLDRLVGRKTEEGAVLARRIAAANEEIAAAVKYDYLIINEDADKCAEEFLGVIATEKLKASRNINFVKSLLL